MLTSDKYQEGLSTLEKTKYNINYCKKLLFDVVCSGFASKLLEHPFNETLNDEQRNALNKLKSK